MRKLILFIFLFLFCSAGMIHIKTTLEDPEVQREQYELGYTDGYDNHSLLRYDFAIHGFLGTPEYSRGYIRGFEDCKMNKTRLGDVENE